MFRRCRLLILLGFAGRDRSPEHIKEAGEIVIGIFSDKAPFGVHRRQRKPAGYDASTATASPLTWASPPKYVPVDAAARTEVLASNKVDITLANFTVTPERAEKVDFANPSSRSPSASSRPPRPKSPT